jgi:hypothetical protein
MGQNGGRQGGNGGGKGKYRACLHLRRLDEENKEWAEFIRGLWRGLRTHGW